MLWNKTHVDLKKREKVLFVPYISSFSCNSTNICFHIFFTCMIYCIFSHFSIRKTWWKMLTRHNWGSHEFLNLVYKWSMEAETLTFRRIVKYCGCTCLEVILQNNIKWYNIFSLPWNVYRFLDRNYLENKQCFVEAILASFMREFHLHCY